MWLQQQKGSVYWKKCSIFHLIKYIYIYIYILLTAAVGAHPVEGGVFPPPPAAAELLTKIPPPESFNVSFVLPHLLQITSCALSMLLYINALKSINKCVFLSTMCTIMS